MHTPIEILFSLNNLRHNFMMKSVYDKADTLSLDQFKKELATEMMLFCEGHEILLDGRYEDYTPWFFNNTPAEVCNVLKNLLPKMDVQHAKENVDAEDIPF